jgi:O-antigen ligase
MKINFFDNIQTLKNLLKIIFYIYPIIMLRQSGYVTSYVSLLTILSLFYFYLNKIKIKFFFSDLLILFFFLFSLFSTLIYLDEFDSLIIFKSISDLRFFLLYLVIRNLFYYSIIKINPLLFISLICCLFLSFDIYIQHIFGSDLFGFPPIDERYNGVFNDEAIAGSYIQKFSLLSILAIFLFKSSNNLKKILLIIIGNILAIGTLLSLDRMPFIVIIFGFFLLIFFIKRLRFILFLNFFIILLIFTFFIEIYSPINKRYFDLNKELNISKITNSILQKKNANNSVENYKITEESLLIGGYGQIFESTLYVYKYNWLIGSGTKSFQKKCYKLSETKKNLSCPPHPHNIYLEILINTGIVGFLIFLVFIINIIINLFRSNNTNNKVKKYISYFFLIIIICELIPLRSYGSIFQTVNGSLFWFILSIVSSYTFMGKNFSK